MGAPCTFGKWHATFSSPIRQLGMLRLLPILLLAACFSSAPSHRELHDGAPMRTTPVEPRITYAPNGTGLPEYWGQPEAKQYPRGTDKRVLPPTREPGIWASDEPQHESSEPSAGIYDKPWVVHERKPNNLIATSLAFRAPGELSDLLPEQSHKVVFGCKWSMHQAAKDVPGAWEIAYLPSRVQQCVNAKLVRHCMETGWNDYKQIALKAPQVADPLMERALTDLLAMAREDHRRVCTGTHLNETAKAYVDGVIAEFDRMMEAGDGLEPKDVPLEPMPRGPKH